MAATNCAKNGTSVINLNLYNWKFRVTVALAVFMGHSSSSTVSEYILLVLGALSKCENNS